MHAIDPTRLPETVRRHLGSARHCTVSLVSGPVRTTGAYWDGGSREEYDYVDVRTGQRSRPAYSTNPPQFGGSVTELSPPEGTVILRSGTFCGKPAVPSIIVVCPVEEHHVAADWLEERGRPEADIVRLMSACEEAASSLTASQRTVLAATRSYKASYGGVSNYRYAEAHRATGITLADWDTAKAECQQAGYLDKRGAITAKGRSVISNHRL